MSEEKSSYRQIMKATSLFGGVQVFNILIGMVRIKFVAVLLGTAGMGIMGLLNSPLQLITVVTGLGIAFSAVRDISEAHAIADQSLMTKAIVVLKKWSWFTGILGLLITVALAPLLSQWTFGNKDYTWAFVCLSLSVLFQALSSSQLGILQGTRNLNAMAKASMLAVLIGLFTSIPLFYFFGMNGIVPSLIVSAFTTLLLSWHFSRKVNVQPVTLTVKQTYEAGKSMVKLGLVMSATSLISSFIAYVLTTYINRTGGPSQVGLYNSGWSIVGQYTGLVFMAMATDYFPRLSAINKDNSKMRELINQQAEMVILILGPLLILLVLTMPFLIHIFYTAAFLPIVIFANWTVIGILLKGIVWPIGFIFPAKGDLKLFGTIELIAMIFSLVCNIFCYHFWELEGLGISFLINYIVGFALTYFFAAKKYEFYYNKTTIRYFLITLLLVVLNFILFYFNRNTISYILGFIILSISVLYSFMNINKLMDLTSIIKKLVLKVKGRL